MAPPTDLRLLALLFLVAAGSAFAAEPLKDAAQLFEEGRSAYARGDYRAAALSFEEALRLAPRGAAAYDAGLAWQGAHELSRAADAYAVALGLPDLSASLRADAKARLAQLERTLGVLEVAGLKGALISVALLKRAPAPLRVHLPPGDYRATAEGPTGKSVDKDVHLEAGATTHWDLPILELAPPPMTSSPLRTAGWVTIGVGAAAAIGAGTLGILTLHAKDRFTTSGNTDQGAHDLAVSLRTWTNVAWGATAVLAATGTALLLWPKAKPQTEGSVGIAVAPIPQGGFVSLSLVR